MYNIKENIKGILCNWLHPKNFNKEYSQITNLASGISNPKLLVNRFPVILLLKERNTYYPKAFEVLFKSLNDTNLLSEIENDYLNCFKFLFAIESNLLGKVKQKFEKNRDE
jgi:hypothetical protein